MALTNSYAELAEFLALPDITSDDETDTVFIERLLERCSREFDGDTGNWYYAYTQTRTFDRPHGRELVFDVPLLSLTTLTNGDGTVITSADYVLRPNNGPHYTSVKLRASSALTWATDDDDSDSEGVISVAGTWGYVDRTATGPESVTPILNSKSAVLYLALACYRKRNGIGTEGVATITGVGVVITPADKSRDYWSIVRHYARLM
jgi:hypothetical protein